MSDERLVKQAEADWHLANHWEKRFQTTVEERDFYKARYEHPLGELKAARHMAREFVKKAGYDSEEWLIRRHPWLKEADSDERAGEVSGGGSAAQPLEPGAGSTDD